MVNNKSNTTKIIDVTEATDDQWLLTCQKCEYATYFHTPQWVDLFSKYSKGRIYPRIKKITFNDNLSAIVPLVCVDFIFGAIKAYQSAPAGTFGGWISSDNLTHAHAQALVDFMLGFSNIVWRENPYDPFLKSIAIAGAARDFTQAIDLTKSEDELRAATSRAHAKALAKARREGVFVTEAQGIDDWKRHFRGYERSLARWKTAGTEKKLNKPYSWELFEAMFKAASPNVKLWCARCKGEVAASVICFYWNRHAVAWHGAALEEYFEVRPNNELYQHMIDDARENGYHWFDCNTPGGLKGVAEFKDHLGTQRLQSRLLDKTSLARKIVRTIKKRL